MLWFCYKECVGIQKHVLVAVQMNVLLPKLKKKEAEWKRASKLNQMSQKEKGILSQSSSFSSLACKASQFSQWNKKE